MLKRSDVTPVRTTVNFWREMVYKDVWASCVAGRGNKKSDESEVKISSLSTVFFNKSWNAWYKLIHLQP